jgi:hypothetical protein
MIDVDDPWAFAVSDSKDLSAKAPLFGALNGFESTT